MSVGMYVRFRTRKYCPPSKYPGGTNANQLPISTVWNVTSVLKRRASNLQMLELHQFRQFSSRGDSRKAQGTRRCAGFQDTCGKTRVTPNAPLPMALVANDLNLATARGLSRLQRATSSSCDPECSSPRAHTYVDVFSTPELLVRNPTFSKILMSGVISDRNAARRSRLTS